jgi:hypothetical protein
MTSSTTVNKNASTSTTLSKKKKSSAAVNKKLGTTPDSGTIPERYLIESTESHCVSVRSENVDPVINAIQDQKCIEIIDVDLQPVVASKVNAPKAKKTRGSKIVTKQQLATTILTPPITNVILNLKCSMNDLKEYNDKLSKMISNPLEYNSSAPPEVKYYDGEKKFSTFIQNENGGQRKSNANRFENKSNKTPTFEKSNGEDVLGSSFMSFPTDDDQINVGDETNTTHKAKVRPSPCKIWFRTPHTASP